jgi:hypothetical protein
MGSIWLMIHLLIPPSDAVGYQIWIFAAFDPDRGGRLIHR